MLQQHDVAFFTRLPAGGFLLIPSELISVFDTYRQINKEDREAGGLLIGSWRRPLDFPQSPHIELITCTEPCKADIRTRYSFERRCNHHIEAVEQAWERSGGVKSYLGEWHTHPEETPRPSPEDTQQWERNLKQKACVVIIVGIQQLWVGFWDGYKATALPKIEHDS